MNKLSLLLVGLMASGMVSAANTLDASGRLALTDCPAVAPLIEDVTIQLSTGVVAGFSCSTAAVAMVACHTAGRVTSRSAMVDDVCTDHDNDPNTAAQCTQKSEAVTGPSFPTATTAGGTVKADYPVSNVVGGCTSANARAHALTKVPES